LDGQLNEAFERIENLQEEVNELRELNEMLSADKEQLDIAY
jgi:FtsZ-binding cell division protein ZapB